MSTKKSGCLDNGAYVLVATYRTSFRSFSVIIALGSTECTEKARIDLQNLILCWVSSNLQESLSIFLNVFDPMVFGQVTNFRAFPFPFQGLAKSSFSSPLSDESYLPVNTATHPGNFSRPKYDGRGPICCVGSHAEENAKFFGYPS